jgi:hypothetical protein
VSTYPGRLELRQMDESPRDIFDSLFLELDQEHPPIITRYEPANPEEPLSWLLSREFSQRQRDFPRSRSRSSSQASSPLEDRGLGFGLAVGVGVAVGVAVGGPRRRAGSVASSDSEVHFNLEPRRTVPKEEGCNCRRSKCLKLYCECFNRREYCTGACNCAGCGNVLENEAEHRQAVVDALLRNPKAFEEAGRSKQLERFDLALEKSEIRKGCRCKKSRCLKKYCECFGAGQSCSRFCRCEDCENDF